MAKIQPVNNKGEERKKQYALSIKPSVIKQLDAIASVESEKDVVMTRRAHLVEKALEAFIQQYKKKNGDTFLLYQ
jgi:hypothetical protein